MKGKNLCLYFAFFFKDKKEKSEKARKSEKKDDNTLDLKLPFLKEHFYTSYYFFSTYRIYQSPSKMCDTLNLCPNNRDCGSPGTAEKRYRKVSHHARNDHWSLKQQQQPYLDLSAISSAQNNSPLGKASPEGASSGLKSPTKRQAATLLTRRKSRPPKLRITAPSIEMMQFSFDQS